MEKGIVVIKDGTIKSVVLLRRLLMIGVFIQVFQVPIWGQLLTDLLPSICISNTPLVSYQVGEDTYTSLSKESPIRLKSEVIPYNYGNKILVTFENISGKEIMLHNVVPMGCSPEYVYITGLGNHGLSRTHLFRPGYEPVNVIVPDNAWELGFSVRKDDDGKKYVALTRRVKGSISDGRVTRFENFLKPGGKVNFTMWVDQYEGEWQKGLKLMFQKRFLYDVEPGTFNNRIFEREDLKWMRDCYSLNQMMVWDKRYFNYQDGQFHYEEYLDKMKKLMGGYDVFLLWPTWPAMGMDQRNQWDMYRTMPGGYAQLKKISEDCHQRGTRLFLCYIPWDGSTRASEGHYEGMTTVTKECDIDGFCLDTSGGSNKELQDAVDKVKPGVIMYSEGMAVPKDMPGIPSGRTHDALYYCPMLNLNKFIKPDFAIIRVAKENLEPIKREFNVAFFNGYGVEINSMGPGRFEWSDDQFRYWGQLIRVQRENKNAFHSFGYKPLIPTLEDRIYVNEWPIDTKTIYTIYSVRPEGFHGQLFEVQPKENMHFVDIYSHEELEAEMKDGKWYMKAKLQAFNSFELGTNNEGAVSAIAQFPILLDVVHWGDKLKFSAEKGTEIRIWNGTPSYEKTYKSYPVESHTISLLEEFPGMDGKFIVQLFDEDEMIDERIIYIVPGTPRLASSVHKTELASKAPKGMVTIPAGIFRCDYPYSTGDSFIKYPEPPTQIGETIAMHKFFMDEHPVTNGQYKEFLDASGYMPADTTNFLKHWIDGKIPEGMENYPVVYVTWEDAKAYAEWAKKRLPTELEWQYAAQTTAANEWPWKQKTPVRRVEEKRTGTLSTMKIEGIEPDRCNLGDGSLYPVKKYPKGKNPYGLYDLVGCVWQLTNDLYDNVTYKYVMVKGGSYFRPASSYWYIQGGPRELYFRQYLLRVSPSFERNSTVGFRCVKDAK